MVRGYLGLQTVQMQYGRAYACLADAGGAYKSVIQTVDGEHQQCYSIIMINFVLHLLTLAQGSLGLLSIY